jgi:hypothetical protein
MNADGQQASPANLDSGASTPNASPNGKGLNNSRKNWQPQNLNPKQAVLSQQIPHQGVVNTTIGGKDGGGGAVPTQMPLRWNNLPQGMVLPQGPTPAGIPVNGYYPTALYAVVQPYNMYTTMGYGQQPVWNLYQQQPQARGNTSISPNHQNGGGGKGGKMDHRKHGYHQQQYQYPNTNQIYNHMNHKEKKRGNKKGRNHDPNMGNHPRQGGRGGGYRQQPMHYIDPNQMQFSPQHIQQQQHLNSQQQIPIQKFSPQGNQPFQQQPPAQQNQNAGQLQQHNQHKNPQRRKEPQPTNSKPPTQSKQTNNNTHQQQQPQPQPHTT